MSDDSSELSSLSSLSPAPPDDESDVELKRQNGILKFFHKVPKEQALKAKEMSPPPRKREPSPTHEYVFADKPDIAFIVMFRKRFDSAMPRSLAHFGPLELEQDLQQEPPAERVEHFLCVVLGLLLNRKQDIKIGHYSKALNEDAINGKDFKPQWPKSWGGKSPLAGSATFQTLTPVQRLDLLKNLILWALGYSDAIKAIINKSYNQKRSSDDLNQPLSVQPWGSDSDKRRYFLIEGDNDTSFRVYRESNPAGFNRTWFSVAGGIDEVKALADKLATTDGGPNARKLRDKIMKNIVKNSSFIQKRRKREYRRLQKERFRRPEPGFSLYEGRTRGKRVKYTYSDDEDFFSDSTTRRSTRNTRNHTPAETGPVVTASGRQSRPPARLTAEALRNGVISAATSVQGDIARAGSPDMDVDMNETNQVGPTGRPRRSAAVHHGTNGWSNPKKRKASYISDDDDDDGSEPDFGDDEEEDHVPEETDEDEEEFEADAMDEDDREIAGSPTSTDSHLVKLRIKVKFDKNGKAKRLPDDDSIGSVSTPSDVRSSDSQSGESSSEGSPIPNQEPQRTEDVVNVAPFIKRATPEPTQTAMAVGEAEALVEASPKRPLSPPSAVNGSLAFRESPEKPQTAAPILAGVVNGE